MIDCWLDQANAGYGFKLRKMLLRCRSQNKGNNIMHENEMELNTNDFEYLHDSIHESWGELNLNERLEMLERFESTVAERLGTESLEIRWHEPVNSEVTERSISIELESVGMSTSPEAFLNAIMEKHDLLGKETAFVLPERQDGKQISFGNSINGICERVCLDKYTYELMSIS